MAQPEDRERDMGEYLAVLMVVWAEFKRTHNLRDAKLQCCNTTRMLFEALDALEQNIKQGD